MQCEVGTFGIEGSHAGKSKRNSLLNARTSKKETNLVVNPRNGYFPTYQVGYLQGLKLLF